MKSSPITAEEFLRNDTSKTNWPQTVDKFNKLVDHFAELYKHKQSKDNGSYVEDMWKIVLNSIFSVHREPKEQSSNFI